MRILYVTNEWIGKEGGGVSHFKEIAHNLSRRGHKLYIVAPGYYCVKPQEWFVPLILIPLPGRNIFSLMLFEFLLGFILTVLIITLRTRVVLNRGTFCSAGLYLVCRMLHCRYIVEINGIGDIEVKHTVMFSIFSKIYRLINNLNYRMADYFICVSQGIKEELVRRWPGFLQRSVAINNGVNEEKFVPLDPVECRKKLNLPLHKFIVGFVGQLSSWHGVDDLIEAARQLKNRGYEEFLTVIIGGDKERLEELKSNVKQYGIGDNVWFIGKISHTQVPLYIGAFDIAAQIHNDPIIGKFGDPLKFWEYLACGRAMLLSDFSSSKIFVKPGLIGWLFKGSDVGDMTDKLEYIINHRSECFEIGRANRHFIENGHRWKDVAEKVEKVLLGEAFSI